MYQIIPVVHWSLLQTQLELAPADVLILLDCCESGGSLCRPNPAHSPTFTDKNRPFNLKPGTTELIAASSFDRLTVGPGKLSFTDLLIHELKALAKKGTPFSVAELHRRILASIVKQRASNGWLSELLEPKKYLSISPVYVRLVGDVEGSSIRLRSLPMGSAVSVGCYWRNEVKYWSPEVFGWRRGRRRGLLPMPMEMHNGSPEVVNWRRGPRRDVLQKTSRWLRDLILKRRSWRPESCGLVL
jgi:hypothetical protein